ncbi:MAG: porin family protein [Parachlamydiales bacterium]|nr:porin family protein [Parachlamydiales bacterium]
MWKKVLFGLLALPILGVSECCDCNCWGSGLYLGIGAGADTVDFYRKAHIQTSFNNFDVIDKTHLAAQGIFGTIFGGYGWSRKMFYVGGELNWNPKSSAVFHYSNVERIHHNGSVVKYEIDQSWGGSLLMGALLQNTALIYGRAGYSRGNFRIRTTDDSLANASAWLNGIRLGAGIAKQIYKNFAIRFEYNHIYYSHHTDTVFIPSAGITQKTRVSPQTNQFEFGFYYTFF